MTQETQEYIPAFRFKVLTPFYDFLLNVIMKEFVIKQRLIDEACLDQNHKILDIGCGTATLTIMIKKASPLSEVTGLDIDSEILSQGQAKITSAGLDIPLVQGSSSSLPYPDNHFDRVFASLMIHHLKTEDKIKTAAEVFRVLKPGGLLMVADFGSPKTPLMQTVSLFTRLFEEVADNIKGILPDIFREAGFSPVEETKSYSTLLGSVSIFKAVKPG